MIKVQIPESRSKKVERRHPRKEEESCRQLKDIITRMQNADSN